MVVGRASLFAGLRFIYMWSIIHMMHTTKNLENMSDVEARDAVSHPIEVECALYDDAPAPTDYNAWAARWEAKALKRHAAGEYEEAADYRWLAAVCNRIIH